MLLRFFCLCKRKKDGNCAEKLNVEFLRPKNTFFFKIHHTCPRSITTVTPICRLNNHDKSCVFGPVSRACSLLIMGSHAWLSVQECSLWEKRSRLHILRAPMEEEMDRECVMHLRDERLFLTTPSRHVRKNNPEDENVSFR